MKIFNFKQADIFIKNGCTVTGCGIGNKFKMYIEFLENETFKNILTRWMAKEF